MALFAAPASPQLRKTKYQFKAEGRPRKRTKRSQIKSSSGVLLVVVGFGGDRVVRLESSGVVVRAVSMLDPQIFDRHFHNIYLFRRAIRYI